MSATRKPEVDYQKIVKAISDWIRDCEAAPLREGERSYLTIAVTHEPGGLAWTTSRGFAQRVP